MKAALIGLSQSGKSTLFSAISGKKAAMTGVATIEEAVVPVPDPRLDFLTEIYKPKKTTPGTIDCLDVPGFDLTSESGRAASRRLINKIRTIDLLVFVIRAFVDPSVVPYRNRIDPAKDLEELKTELLISDLELISTRIEKLEVQVKKPSKTQASDKVELELFHKLQEAVESEKPIRSAISNDTELEIIKSLGFLTLKPLVVAINVGEDQLDQKFEFPGLLEPDTPVIEISAQLEQELSQLDAESRKEFMSDLGIKESAKGKFVNSCYRAVGLISFLTSGTDEVRAWPIKDGTKALDAAGKIHSDIKRGFIRAETYNFEDLKELGSEKEVKAAGKVHLEGKEYIVKDGDIINFRFNV